MRKMFIFRNIQQDHRNENWDQNKIILATEIKKKTESIDHKVIIKQTERVHRAKEKQTWRKFACNCKIHQLDFFQGSENQFHQEKDGNNHTPIFILQMYSPALTM